MWGKCAGLTPNEGGWNLAKDLQPWMWLFYGSFLAFFSTNLLSFVRASSVLKVSSTPPVIIPNLALKGEDEGRRKQSKCSKYSWMKKGKKLCPPHFSKHHSSLLLWTLSFRGCLVPFYVAQVFTNVFRQPWLSLRRVSCSKESAGFCSVRRGDPRCRVRVWSGAHSHPCLLCRWPMRVIWNTCGSQCVGCSLISGLPFQGRAMLCRKKNKKKKTHPTGSWT